MPDKPDHQEEDLRIYRGLTLSADSLPTPEERQKHLDRVPPPPLGEVSVCQQRNGLRRRRKM